jgi:class 3 adenylate cyclase/outer membrane protein assembly factor BamB
VARRLAAIVAVDIVGYSRLMAVDEDGTWLALNELRALIDPILETDDGRIVKSTGDGVLVEAPSVVGAVRAAIEVQEAVDVWNRDRPADRAFRLRIGINLGDIIVADDGDVYGDGVNVAARLEGLAEPGGICISDSAYRQIRGRIDARFVDRGEQWVKNIPTPVQVWAVLPSGSGEGPTDLGVSGLEHPEVVGRGGHATVYRAYQRTMDRWVAVKILDGSDEATRRRFDRERQVMGRLSQHPAVVTIYESGYTTVGRPYLLMPYLGAGSLQDRLDQSGPMPWEDAAAIVRDVADAVDHAHRLDIIHRDLKPSNIMLDDDGRPLIADFGIARMTGRSVTVTERALLTPAYSPPELLDGAEPSPTGDIYGLAATFCALVTGHPPFVTGSPEIDTLLALTRRIADDPPPDVAAWGVPDDARHAVETAMSKDPTRRPETARQFADMLTGRPVARGGVAVGHTAAETKAKPVRPAALTVAVTLAAIVMGISVFGILNSGSPPLDPTTTTGSTTLSAESTSTTEAAQTVGIPGAAWTTTLSSGIVDLAGNDLATCAQGTTCPGIVAVLLADGTIAAVDVRDGSDPWGSVFDLGLASSTSNILAFRTEADIQVAGNRIVVVRVGTRLLYSVNLHDGSQSWRTLSPFDSAMGGPRLAAAGNDTYVGYGLGIARLDRSGTSIWENDSAATLLVTDVSAGQQLITAIDGRSVYRFNAENGARLWELGPPIISAPVWVLAQEVETPSGAGRSFDRRVLVTTERGELLVLDGDDRTVRWTAAITLPPGSAPTDRVFVTGVDGEPVSLWMNNGEVDWVNPGIRADRPLVASDGRVHAISGTALITLNSRSGTEVRRISLPGIPTTDLVVVGDMVIVGIDALLVAIPTVG